MPLLQSKQRICKVSGFSVELLEMHSDDASLHIIVIPGNPGVVSMYKYFVEELYRVLEGNASITAIGHTAHTRKAMEYGRLFSLQEQIDHKVDYIKQETRSNGLPIILVGHSIGAYISLEVFKRLQSQVKFVVGLYPFLTVNKKSSEQSQIAMLARSSILSASVSYIVSFLGLLPKSLLRPILRQLSRMSLSSTTVDIVCTHLKYHTMRNVLYMAMTSFAELVNEPDWSFMKKSKDNLAFLFGDDDHWGPLPVFNEISRQVPDIELSLEEEGHTHNFNCTEAGSIWVARHVATLIKHRFPN